MISACRISPMLVDIKMISACRIISAPSWLVSANLGLISDVISLVYTTSSSFSIVKHTIRAKMNRRI